MHEQLFSIFSGGVLRLWLGAMPWASSMLASPVAASILRARASMLIRISVLGDFWGKPRNRWETPEDCLNLFCAGVFPQKKKE